VICSVLPEGVVAIVEEACDLLVRADQEEKVAGDRVEIFDAAYVAIMVRYNVGQGTSQHAADMWRSLRPQRPTSEDGNGSMVCIVGGESCS
jgi:hypothetical protein